VAIKQRKAYATIGPEDGERVLTICLKKLKLLSPEWRKWVLKTLEAHGQIGLRDDQLPMIPHE
jgi:hypothetical protein